MPGVDVVNVVAVVAICVVGDVGDVGDVTGVDYVDGETPTLTIKRRENRVELRGSGTYVPPQGRKPH